MSVNKEKKPFQQVQPINDKKNNTNKLQVKQMEHLIKIIKLRYISPYKIMYMISQTQADYFKARNQASGCCSSATITIPKHKMTKTQTLLSQAINQVTKAKELNHILEELSDKYSNIVKSGQKENLKVDINVEKFLLQKVMSEGINLHIYKNVMERLKHENESFASSAMLWATPNTWYSRFPDVKLDYLSGKTLSQLNEKDYSIQNNFLEQYKQGLLKELVMLQRDGKFQELIWISGSNQQRNDSKLMNFPQNYAFDGSQDSLHPGKIVYPFLKKSLLTLRSIPFQLNEKMNSYCTISQNNQISFFKPECEMLYTVKSQTSSRYSTFCPIGGACQLQIQLDESGVQKIYNQTLKEGGLLISDSQKIQKITFRSKSKNIFLFRSWVCTLPNKNKNF